MKLHLIATAEDVGTRIDVYLTKQVQGFSRTHAQAAIKAGQVTVNGKTVTPHYALRIDEVIDMDAEEKPKEISMKPWKEGKLDILHEDDDVIVINKPSGMLVHPAVPTDHESLAHALLAHFPKIAKVGEDVTRPGIMHRLDRDASGVMVVAKTKKAYENLKEQFQMHDIEKVYTVLVEGTTPEDSGTIRLAIGRKKGDGKMAARHLAKDGDKEAITHYRVEERWPRATLLTVRTETGRTHQIRAHMHAIGCAVAGDPLYGTGRPNRLPVPHLFLHAGKLSFNHPKTGERMSFEAPLPKELQHVIKGLEGNHKSQ
ncbi:MAG: hypothetical protein RLZZ324_1322 [Candidatus Parcubacteria bacterium]|jgi:23S rRNA pseudouridine1911/1915/1917 synthase